MPENHRNESHRSESHRNDFSRAFDDARKQAGSVANEVSGAAQDLYDQTRASTSQVTVAAKTAAQTTANSFERALRRTVEDRPYTAALVVFALGWLFGRTHRPI